MTRQSATSIHSARRFSTVLTSAFIASRSSQRGAVLFVALIMLLLLTLLGVTAMQVTTLQERMAGNLRLQQQAFENTERRISTAQDAVRDPIVAADTVQRAPVGLVSNALPWEKWLEGRPADEDLNDNPLTRVRYCVACPGTKGAVWGEDPARKPRYYIVSGVGFESNPDADLEGGANPDIGSSKDAIAVLQSVYVF
jgi:hypothetical protein